MDTDDGEDGQGWGGHPFPTPVGTLVPDAGAPDSTQTWRVVLTSDGPSVEGSPPIRLPGIVVTRTTETVNDPRHVNWGESDLSQAVVAVRSHTELGTYNGAAIEYRVGAELRIEVGFSRRNVGHAEQLLWASLAARGVRPDQVTRIYSELQPCDIPVFYCDRWIRRTFPLNTQVTWSLPYPGGRGDQEEAAARTRANSANTLFTIIKQFKKDRKKK
jgi:hypothetical protein